MDRGVSAFGRAKVGAGDPKRPFSSVKLRRDPRKGARENQAGAQRFEKRQKGRPGRSLGKNGERSRKGQQRGAGRPYNLVGSTITSRLSSKTEKEKKAAQLWGSRKAVEGLVPCARKKTRRVWKITVRGPERQGPKRQEQIPHAPYQRAVIRVGQGFTPEGKHRHLRKENEWGVFEENQKTTVEGAQEQKRQTKAGGRVEVGGDRKNERGDLARS